MATPAGVVAVVGVGVGIGGAVAARFAQAGYVVALMGRTADKLRQVEAEVHAAAGAGAGRTATFVVDAGDPQSVQAAFAAVKQQLGPVDVLVYNAGPQFQRKSILETDPKVRVPIHRHTVSPGGARARGMARGNPLRVPLYLPSTHGLLTSSHAPLPARRWRRASGWAARARW
jgi:NAD(P)-dependent dehydrogenase (short-subunit alcohol dehydrogenase family)